MKKRKKALIGFMVLITLAAGKAKSQEASDKTDYPGIAGHIITANKDKNADEPDSKSQGTYFWFHPYFFGPGTDSLSVKPDSARQEEDEKGATRKYSIPETQIFIGNDGQIYTL